MVIYLAKETGGESLITLGKHYIVLHFFNPFIFM